MHQRQSINEGLMGNNERERSHGMMGQGQSGGVSSSVNGNQMFTRFSNIQLQNSLNKNNKIGGSNGRAFQSVNNFFNPRTAGGKAQRDRDRMPSHLQASDIMSPHPLSPGGYNRKGIEKRDDSNVGKNAFSPRMKLGHTPNATSGSPQFGKDSEDQNGPTFNKRASPPPTIS